MILDTINRFWSVRDENDNASVNREAGRWLELARDTGSTVLLVAHEGKTGGERRALDTGRVRAVRARGPGALARPTQGRRPEPSRVTRPWSFEESPAELVLDLDGDAYTVLGTPEQADMDATARKLAGVLTAEAQTFAELAEAADISERMVRKTIRKLEGVVIEGKGTKGSPLTARRA